MDRDRLAGSGADRGAPPRADDSAAPPADDVGTGLPTADNTHEVAQRIAPAGRSR